MKTEIKEITPNDAMLLLSKDCNNRKLSSRTVNYYAHQMQKGNWRLTGQGISISEDGSVLDGQHRLAAIVKADIPNMMLVISGIKSDTFDVYDTGKNRSYGDIFHIANIKNGALTSAIITKYLKFSANQTSFESTHMAKINISKHDVLKLYEAEPEFWQSISTICLKCYHKIRLYAPSLIGGFASYLIKDVGHNIKTVENFLFELFIINPDRCNNTKLLRETLIKNALTTKQYPLKTKVVFLIKSWNIYDSGKTRKVLKYQPDEQYPKIK